jgi:hypothetical protein
MPVGPGETFGLIAVAFAAVKIFGPIAAALGRRLSGVRPERAPGPVVIEELDALRERLHRLEEMQTRMVELEERLDFTERLLAQPAQSARLGADVERRG